MRIDRELLNAMEGLLSLLNPGEYGVADTDPKAQVIRDLAEAVRGLGTPPVVIGGIAVILNGYARQTADVDLLVARDDAVPFLRAIEASGKFRRLKLDRWRHVDTGIGLDICVEGELTDPGRSERFPSPRTVDKIHRSVLAVVGLLDLLTLKAKSGRAKDEADFVCLVKEHGLSESLLAGVVDRLSDQRVKEEVSRWWKRASAEVERERDMRPTWGNE